MIDRKLLIFTDIKFYIILIKIVLILLTYNQNKKLKLTKFLTIKIYIRK